MHTCFAGTPAFAVWLNLAAVLAACTPETSYSEQTAMSAEAETGSKDFYYEALGMLQEVVASMIDAARAVRVDCPGEGPAA